MILLLKYAALENNLSFLCKSSLKCHLFFALLVITETPTKETQVRIEILTVSAEVT